MGPAELYVFLEFVPGGSIAQMLTRFGCFNEMLIRHYTRQLLLGLEYLHGCKARGKPRGKAARDLVREYSHTSPLGPRRSSTGT